MMRHKIRILNIAAILILFIMSGSLIAQTGWYPLESGTKSYLKSINFVNETVGFMAGDDIVLKTVNGGENWQTVNNHTGGNSIHFVNALTGYLCDGTIFKSTNGGLNWVNLNLTSLTALYFLNENTGYAVGRNGQIIRTTNGGVNWVVQFAGLLNNKFNSVLFLNDNVGFVIGGKSEHPYYGVIYKTIDGGNTWNQVHSSEDIDFRSIDFVNNNTGYAVGGYEYASSGVIYKTTNNGETWVQRGIVNKDLNSVYFPTPNIGYAVGEDGMILKTIDGSVVWNTQVSNTNEDLKAVYFIRDNLGFTAGKEGNIQKTQNGGMQGPPFGIAGRVTLTNGQPVNSGVVKALQYNAITNTIIVIDQAQIQSNGTYILPNIPQDSLDIMAFPNDEDEENPLPPAFVPTYYAGNNLPTINWVNSKTLYPTGNLFNINVTVYPISGSGGARIIGGGVYNSPPNISSLQGAIVYAMSGNEFKGYSISRTQGVYDINNLASGDYRVICDRFGYRNSEKNVTLGNVNLDTVNFYLLGIGVIGIQPAGGIIPKTYSLEQNYPNPFNPSTNFNVDIPKSSLVKVAVFDMLGREIEILVNEVLQPGQYKLKWNAASYSSGIYFYKIITGEFTATKKMILVK